MFFKMLKSDLKRRRGLNIILFVFISVAAVLMFTGAVQILSNLTKDKAVERLCRPSDMLLIASYNDMGEDETKGAMPAELSSHEEITEWEYKKMTEIEYSSLDFRDYDEEDLSWDNFYLSAMPSKLDLVYDTNDDPFYVPNGCAAISVGIAQRTGAKTGDVFSYTTETGKVYELKIDRIFKENITGYIDRIIVSDADYEVLTADSVIKDNVYGVRVKESTYAALNQLVEKIRERITVYGKADVTSMSNDDAILHIISLAVVGVSIFLIAIIFMTIRFTMVADLKNEEKEIGMMKALGVDSLSFRWLFAAKYIAFAIVGGVIGIAAGIPLAGLVVNMFGPDCILPRRWEMLLIGVVSVLSMISVMILFSLLVMRRINRITVIDALHGENRGERFTKGFPLFMHKRRKMSVPMFLALTDILGRFKRYIFLIIAYTFGAAMILLIFNLRNSNINPEYTRFWMVNTYDFDIDLSEEQREDIHRERARTGKYFWEIVNDRIASAGIPAHIDIATMGFASADFDGTSQSFMLYWGEGVAEKQLYQKGGKVPTLENEAAMSAYTANHLGVNVGDVLNVRFTENNEDGTDTEEHEREVVITALIDYMEEGVPVIVMNDHYDTGYAGGRDVIGYCIDTPEKQKPAVIKQLKELFGDEQILTAMEGIKEDMKKFDRIFFLLEYIVGGALLIVIILITYLYSNIFVYEEMPEIALLKSMGFRNGGVRKWYILRMLILTLISLVCAEIMAWSCGTPMYRAFMKQYHVTGVKLELELPVSFVVIPLIVASAILLTAYFTAIKVKNIDIWNISEE
ncbi:ABC transporter permease [Ruminococcus sp.]|uniref:ABC transporter permease n=1 Tax=Ruminococcus sp. TaxID=41978 RepID=UPI0025D58884|nr:ABC transporter permease [Ruminococcus sp.]